jgi:hypothetical protein
VDWQVVQIPLAAFEGSGMVTAIRFNGNLEGPSTWTTSG